MNIIMHFPQSREAKKILQQKVAEIHLEVIISHIQKLGCPKEQKIQLVESLKDCYS